MSTIRAQLLRILSLLEEGRIPEALDELPILIDLPDQYGNGPLIDLLRVMHQTELNNHQTREVTEGFLYAYAAEFFNAEPIVLGQVGMEETEHLSLLYEAFHERWRNRLEAISHDERAPQELLSLAIALGTLWRPLASRDWEKRANSQRLWKAAENSVRNLISVVRADRTLDTAELFDIASLLVLLQCVPNDDVDRTAATLDLSIQEASRISPESADEPHQLNFRSLAERLPSSGNLLLELRERHENRPRTLRDLFVYGPGLGINAVKADELLIPIDSRIGFKIRNSVGVVVSGLDSLAILYDHLAALGPRLTNEALYKILTDDLPRKLRNEPLSEMPNFADDAPRDSNSTRQAGNLASLSDGELLLAGLGLLRDVWAKELEGPEALELAVVIPSPAHELEIEFSRPALLVEQGSLVGRIVTGPVKLAGFILALGTPGGQSVISRSRLLARELRSHAMNDPENKALRDLRDIRAVELEQSSGLVVLLHGLLSTDIGTFDPMLDSLEEQGVVVAGFPHDTLRPIEANASDLAQLLAQLSSRDASWPIVFVCHSRGGLVARSAAVSLFDTRHDAWVRRIRGCVTFGTPHKGACLAESPGEMAGVFLISSATGSCKTPSVLVSTLVIWSKANQLHGICDLRPWTEGDDFIARLERKETARPELNLFAIGGEANGREPRNWLSAWAIGGEPSDLVVEISSSLPVYASQQLQVACDHFGYIQDTESRERAIEFVKQCW